MEKDKLTNYNREAFLYPANLLFLVGASTLAFFFNDAEVIPQLIFATTIGIELVYLGTVPRLPVFRKFIEARKSRERGLIGTGTSLFEGLDEDARKRFLVLKHLTKLIRENFERLPYASSSLSKSVSDKLNGLLNNYLNVLDLFRKYERYLTHSTDAAIRQEIQSETNEMEATSSEKLKAIKARRIAILNKRLERFVVANEKFAIAETQLETTEDAIRYIYEQSMTMSKPEDIDFQLDHLILEVEETVTIMEEVEADLMSTLTMTREWEVLDKDLREKPASKVTDPPI